MRALGYHPPHIADNADTLHLANQHRQQAVSFFLYVVLLFLRSSVFLRLSQSLNL